MYENVQIIDYWIDWMIFLCLNYQLESQLSSFRIHKAHRQYEKPQKDFYKYIWDEERKNVRSIDETHKYLLS
jgi:hypothetical protein